MNVNKIIGKGEILDLAQGIIDGAKAIFSEEDSRELKNALMEYLVTIAELQTEVVNGLNALDYAIEKEERNG